MKVYKIPLLPFEALYWLGLEAWYFSWKRRSRKRLDKPTVSVGNLTIGGSGKTPLSIYLANRFLREGHKPLILTRGYKRKRRGQILLKDKELRPEEVGDEASLMFKKLQGRVPILVNKDRLSAAKWAVRYLSPDVFILDDGHQYLEIKPHISLVLFTKEDLEERPHLIPVGRWRESPEALRRADAVLVNLKLSEAETEIPGWIEKNFRGPIFTMRYSISGFIGVDDKEIGKEALIGKKVFLFAGIANPKSFYDAFSIFNVKLVGKKTFLDHHFYSDKEIKGLIKRAKKLGADVIITTEKDLIRIEDPPEEVLALQIEVVIDAEKKFLEWLKTRLFSHLPYSQDA